MRNHSERGIALITTLLLLLLISTMIVGVAWLVTGDQKLGGNNADRQLAFYGAEAGMESLTASLENLFNSNYAPTSSEVNALMTTPGPPTNIPGIQYIAPGMTSPGSGYQVNFDNNPNLPNFPASNPATITTGAYVGLEGIMTPFTLTVTARTANGSEVQLQRTVQTVGIPVFQFGFFSTTDLSFFASPTFTFGGRVHTNGNLWLAEGTGNTLTLPAPVTTAGQVITANLVNGALTSSNNLNSGGTQILITNGSSNVNLLAQTTTQSVTGTASMSNYFQNISSYNSAFATMDASVYKDNIGIQETGVKPLSLAITTPSIGGQSIDLLRRPQHGENSSNPAKLQERYYDQPLLSMRILLSDYGSDGTCATSDISSTSSTSLPALAPNGSTPTTPVDLATLAWNTSATTYNPNDGAHSPPYNAAPSWLTSYVGSAAFPLPVSGAASTSYSSTNGYWIQPNYPIITGCIKIEYQSNSTPGTWVDVTGQILELGYTGRNINPQSSSTPASPSLPSLPSSGTQINAQGPEYSGSSVAAIACTDPSPNAVIRLARVRDNPSYWTSGSAVKNCGVWPTTTSNQYGTDYWPNVLWDTREGTLRDSSLSGNAVTLAGAMYYVELDVANLAKWFAGTIPTSGSSGPSALNTSGYGVYFSDRRNEIPDNSPPPPSVGGTSALTGGFGYEDFVNPSGGSSPANGCPNGSLDGGEDVEGDYNSSGVDTNPILRTYGHLPQFDIYTPTATSTPISGVLSTVLQNNPNCTGSGITWPFAVAAVSNQLRENPALLFRRALKLIHGDTINQTNWPNCNSIVCGLTIVSENPVYIQGCYNNPGECNMTSSSSWSTTNVAASVIADAVTLLSDKWNDVNSFASPYAGGSGTGRQATSTTYRLGIVGGKGVPFKQPTYSGVTWDMGTDGGAHNFMRLLENWPSGTTTYYNGSVVSMYYNHQAVGLYKCCTVVYWPGTRAFQFDTNFLTPAKLPPLTPMLRLVNTIGFTQVITPTE